MLQGVHLIIGFTSFPLSLEDYKAWKLVDLVFIQINANQAWMMRACRVRTHAAFAHPRRSAWAHLCAVCPGHVVHARTQQHIWQAALCIPCATVELRRCEQGSIKHPGGAFQAWGADLTLLYLSHGPTPPLTSPLDPACGAAII